MSVLVEAISVVIRLTTLRAKYPGGVQAYREDCPNNTYCADTHLSRVGFMVPDDVGAFIDRLERHGIVHVNGDASVDIVVIDQMSGPTSFCDWVQSGRHADGYSAAWKKGTIPGWFAHPSGWTPRPLKLTRIDNNEVDECLLWLKEGSVDVVLDFKTGREVFIGRVRSG